MNRRLIVAPVLAALSLSTSAQLPVGDAALTASTRHMLTTRMTTAIEGAEGPTFVVVVSRSVEFNGFRVLGRAPLDQRGSGKLELNLPAESELPVNFRIYLRAAYLTRAGLELSSASSLLLNPTPVERLNFTWSLDGERVVAGDVLHDQWQRRGISIRAESNNASVRELGVAIDSSEPGQSKELQTPGRGRGNDQRLLNLLAIAGSAEDRNEDQRVDRPMAEELGGRIFFDFQNSTFLDRITLVNVASAGSSMRCYANGLMLGEVPIPVGGTNSVQTIGFPFEAVTQLEVRLSGGSAIAELSYLPCPEVINFDRTMTGIPVDLAPGEELREQLAGKHAVRFSARTNNPANAGKAVILPRPEVAYSSEDGRRRFEENVVVIAKNMGDRDRNGFIDRPEAEPMGGVILIDFDTTVRFGSARVADVDEGEVSYFVAEDARGNELGVYPLLSLGDNQIQTIRPDVQNVKRLRLHLGGSAALVDLSYCSEDEFPRLSYVPPAVVPEELDDENELN